MDCSPSRRRGAWHSHHTLSTGCRADTGAHAECRRPHLDPAAGIARKRQSYRARNFVTSENRHGKERSYANLARMSKQSSQLQSQRLGAGCAYVAGFSDDSVSKPTPTSTANRSPWPCSRDTPLRLFHKAKVPARRFLTRRYTGALTAGEPNAKRTPTDRWVNGKKIGRAHV